MNISRLFAINCMKSNLDSDGKFVSIIQIYRVSPNLFFTSIPNAFNQLKKVLRSNHGKKGVDYEVTYESDRCIRIKTNNIEYKYYIEYETIRIK